MWLFFKSSGEINLNVKFNKQTATLPLIEKTVPCTVFRMPYIQEIGMSWEMFTLVTNMLFK
jgi:hypothetical protein